MRKYDKIRYNSTEEVKVLLRLKMGKKSQNLLQSGFHDVLSAEMI